MFGTDGIGVALEWLSKRDDIRACERRPRLALTPLKRAFFVVVVSKLEASPTPLRTSFMFGGGKFT